MRKKNLLILIFILICLMIFLVFNNNTSNNSKKTLMKIPDRSFNYLPIKDITYNKVIIIGDSRMEFLNDRGDSIKIPSNFDFIALGGTRINWFANDAKIQLEKKLENMDDRYKYHVVINMGVNDLNDLIPSENHAKEYFSLFYDLCLKYDNVNFYILSVNPINDKIINRYFRPQYRTTNKIEKFNSKITGLINVNCSNNLFYCDSYNNMEFGTPDGLHYDKDTDQRIVNYIVNDCVKY